MSLVHQVLRIVLLQEIHRNRALVPKEIQDSVLGDTLQGTSTPGLPLSPPSVSRCPRLWRKESSEQAYL